LDFSLSDTPTYSIMPCYSVPFHGWALARYMPVSFRRWSTSSAGCIPRPSQGYSCGICVAFAIATDLPEEIAREAEHFKIKIPESVKKGAKWRQLETNRWQGTNRIVASLLHTGLALPTFAWAWRGFVYSWTPEFKFFACVFFGTPAQLFTLTPRYLVLYSSI
jgi:hypothetical protein